MNLVDLQRAAEQGRRGKLETFPAGSVSNMRLDEALEWAAGALAKIQVCVPSRATRRTVFERPYILGSGDNVGGYMAGRKRQLQP